MMNKLRSCRATRAELMNSALAHYDKASTAVMHWDSDIPKAIRYYYLDGQKPNKEESVYFGIGLILGFIIGLVF